MKSKNFNVVFSSWVYLAGNSNAPKIAYLPPPPLSAGGFSFCIRNKVKSEIFHTKNLLTKMCLSVLTENLNWESLTENLVNYKFIIGVHWKIWFF